MKCVRCPLYHSWNNESDCGEECAIFGDGWNSPYQYEDKDGTTLGCYLDRHFIEKAGAERDALCAACGKTCDKSKFVYNAPQDEQVILCPEHYGLSTLPSVTPTTKKCHNVNPDYAECDQFVCSNCGIELQDWRRVERDEDGEITYHEYEFRFCPNCGAKL